jgi:hypothetical protein
MNNPFDFPADYIDSGFWQITEKTAKKLCKGVNLPIDGYERVIVLKPDTKIVLSRTIIGALEGKREQVWSVRFHPISF